MTNSIEVINLSKKYKDKEAVTNINFKINENEMVGLLGPNGCGKTTTIGMILGLLKPSRGEVLINGMNIEKNKISLLPYYVRQVKLIFFFLFYNPLKRFLQNHQFQDLMKL